MSHSPRYRLALAALELGTTVLIVALLWQLTAGSSSIYAPPLSDVVSSFRTTWLFDHVGSDLLPSLKRLVLGFAIAVVAGAGLGFLFGFFAIPRLMFRPVTTFFRSIPSVALLPISLVLFGLTDLQKAVFIGFACMWPILLNTEDGVAELDPTVRDSARAYRVSGWRFFTRVMFPATLPRIFAGMRTSLGYALLLLVIAELVGSTNGLGFQLTYAASSFQIAPMWGTVLVLGILGVALNWSVEAVERRAIRWHYGRRAR